MQQIEAAMATRQDGAAGRRGGLLALFALAVLGACEDLPPPAFPLVDSLALLDAPTARHVRQVCHALEEETGAELGVHIVDSTRGRDVRRLASRIHEFWGVGKPGLNNGVLLLFAVHDRTMALEVGSRYQALFPRSVIDQLTYQVVAPLMKRGRRQQAVSRCVEEVAARIHRHEASRSTAARRRVKGRPATFGRQPSGLILRVKQLRRRTISLGGLAAWLALLWAWFLLVKRRGWRPPPLWGAALVAGCGPAWSLIYEHEALAAESLAHELPAALVCAAASAAALLWVYLMRAAGQVRGAS